MRIRVQSILTISLIAVIGVLNVGCKTGVSWKNPKTWGFKMPSKSSKDTVDYSGHQMAGTSGSDRPSHSTTPAITPPAGGYSQQVAKTNDPFITTQGTQQASQQGPYTMASAQQNAAMNSGGNMYGGYNGYSQTPAPQPAAPQYSYGSPQYSTVAANPNPQGYGNPSGAAPVQDPYPYQPYPQSQPQPAVQPNPYTQNPSYQVPTQPAPANYQPPAPYPNYQSNTAPANPTTYDPHGNPVAPRGYEGYESYDNSTYRPGSTATNYGTY